MESIPLYFLCLTLNVNNEKNIGTVMNNTHFNPHLKALSEI